MPHQSICNQFQTSGATKGALCESHYLGIMATACSWHPVWWLWQTRACCTTFFPQISLLEELHMLCKTFAMTDNKAIRQMYYAQWCQERVGLVDTIVSHTWWRDSLKTISYILTLDKPLVRPWLCRALVAEKSSLYIDVHCNDWNRTRARHQQGALSLLTWHMPRLVAKMTMGARALSSALFRYVKHSMSSMCTSSMNSTPGMSSATPSPRQHKKNGWMAMPAHWGMPLSPDLNLCQNRTIRTHVPSDNKCLDKIAPAQYLSCGTGGTAVSICVCHKNRRVERKGCVLVDIVWLLDVLRWNGIQWQMKKPEGHDRASRKYTVYKLTALPPEKSQASSCLAWSLSAWSQHPTKHHEHQTARKERLINQRYTMAMTAVLQQCNGMMNKAPESHVVYQAVVKWDTAMTLSCAHPEEVTLVNVSVDYLVDLLPQLFCYLSLLGFHHLAHHWYDVLTALRPCIRSVKVVQSDILNNFLLLVDITLQKMRCDNNYKPHRWQDVSHIQDWTTAFLSSLCHEGNGPTHTKASEHATKLWSQAAHKKVQNASTPLLVGCTPTSVRAVSHCPQVLQPPPLFTLMTHPGPCTPI